MKIVGFSQNLAPHFEAINKDWIERYFTLEPIDQLILGNPKEKIIDDGGAILFAVESDEVLGTVALKKHSEEVVELTKMGVYEKARNRGVGRKLILAVLEKAEDMGFKKIVLYSSRKLENAIHLYRKMGFQELSCYDDLYERCDIKMELSLNQNVSNHPSDNQ